MNHDRNKSRLFKELLGVSGVRGTAVTAFAGLIVIYIAFGILNPTVFSRHERA